MADIPKADFVADAQDKISATFITPPTSQRPRLAFDPRGQLVEVRNADRIVFSQLFGNGDPSQTNWQTAFRTELPFFKMGIAARTTAKIEFEHDDDSSDSLEIEMEEAPTGEYALRVGDLPRGAMTVTDDSSDTHGRVEFSDKLNAGQVFLDFEPLGQLIELSRNGESYFARNLPERN